MRANHAGVLGLSIVCALSAWLWHESKTPALVQVPPPPPRPTASAVGAPTATAPKKRLQGDLNATFLVASDTHIGFLTPEAPGRDPLLEPVGIEHINLAMIDAMNKIADKPLPRALGGRVQQPKALLVSGDLTEDGGPEQWRLWTRLYGLTGKEGALQLPVFEGAGNHDRNKNWYVREQVAKRHGGRFYSFDMGDLRLICLGEAPDDEGLLFLAKALSEIETDVPVVVYFHYPLLGAYSNDQWFGRGDFRKRLAAQLRGHRIVGIFHGHYHATGAYRWEGFDVYNVGSPKYVQQSFAVVEISEDTMKVAEYDYTVKKWIWWHAKSLSAQGSPEIVGVEPNLRRKLRPAFSLSPHRARHEEAP